MVGTRVGRGVCERMGKFVLGIGNVLFKDEGIGCHVVHALERINLPDVTIVDAGTCSDVGQFLSIADKLVIVDAVKGGGTPGQIYRFRLKDVTLEQKPFLSLHDVSLVDSLTWLRLWHPDSVEIGEAVVIGVEPKEVDWGLELSPELRDRMSQIVEAVLAELDTSVNLSSEERNMVRA